MLALVLSWIVATPGALTADEARAELARRGIGLNTQRFVLACQGEPEVVRLSLAAGMSPDAVQAVVGRYGWTRMSALGAAVEKDQPAIVTMLLEAGVDVEAEVFHDSMAPDLAQRGFHPLHLAVALDRVEIVRRLLAAGASLESGDRVGRTALQVAILHDRGELVELLLAAGAPIDSLGPVSPLSEAGRCGRTVLMERLLRAGATPNAVGPRGRTALHHASQSARGAEPIAILLRAGAGLEDRDARGNTPLLSAARTGRTANVAQLLGAGADVSARDNEGWSALMFAQQRQEPAIESALRAAGAELDSRDQIPLWWARRVREELYILILTPTPIILLAIGLLLLRRL